MKIGTGLEMNQRLWKRAHYKKKERNVENSKTAQGTCSRGFDIMENTALYLQKCQPTCIMIKGKAAFQGIPFATLCKINICQWRI